MNLKRKGIVTDKQFRVRKEGLCVTSLFSFYLQVRNKTLEMDGWMGRLHTYLNLKNAVIMGYKIKITVIGHCRNKRRQTSTENMKERSIKK